MGLIHVADISNWQRGINLAVLPLDGAIVKATQGAGYLSPSFADQIAQNLALNRYTGAYHYIDGSGVEGEARKFVEAVKPYLGGILVALDWESGSNAKWGDESYLLALMRRVKELTHVARVVVYCSAKAPYPWAIVDANDGLRWVAQYASNDIVWGFQANPWNEGAYDCAIRQYTGRGRLDGWGGELDLNKVYITAEAWLAACAIDGVAPSVPDPAPADTDIASVPVMDLVAAVMLGEYGDGDERKAKLGCRYDEVRRWINYIDRAPVQSLVAETWAGKYGNGSRREAILGRRFGEVRAAINAEKRVYTVVKGDTLSGIGAKLGVSWQALARMNDITNPSLIYPGQRIRY